MVTALVLSGGTGTRMGTQTPKQYIQVNGRPIISYCLRTLFCHEGIDAVQIVADEMWRETILESMKRKPMQQLCAPTALSVPRHAACSMCASAHVCACTCAQFHAASVSRQTWGTSMRKEHLETTLRACSAENVNKEIAVANERETCSMPCAESRNKLRGFSVPGKTRQLSILNGLEDIRRYAGDLDYVLIHDAARPLLSARQISDCLDAVTAGHDGALPVLPMKDTVYFSEDGRSITSLLERSRIFAGQAPEIFVLGKYYEANRRLLPDEILQINGSSEPAVMAGMDIAMIPGDEGNYKITTMADLERFRERIVDGFRERKC